MLPGETKNAAIIRLHLLKYTQRQIVEAVGVSFSKISKVLKHYKQTGLSLSEMRIGRPIKVNNKELLAFVEQKTRENRRTSCQRIASLWNHNNENTFTISATAIYDIRHALQYKFKSPKVRQVLTEYQIEKRNKFAHSLLDSNPDFKKFVFSDESRVCLGPDNRYCWYKRAETDSTVFKEYQKKEISVMIWAAIGYNYKSHLIFCPNKVDAIAYREIIRQSCMIEDLNGKIGEGEWIFQQDGAKPHTASTTIRFLRKRMTLLDNWPANSPDINPIEHLWSILKVKLQEAGPKTLNALKSSLKEIWDSIPMEVINNLVLSFRTRLILLSYAKGNHFIHLYAGYKPWRYHYNADHIEHINVILKQDKLLTDVDDTQKRSFTLEEDKLLLDLYMRIGPKWTRIAKFFTNRTSIELRNHFVSLRRISVKNLNQLKW